MGRPMLRVAFLAGASTLLADATQAGGFDRVGNAGIDLLFSPDAVATDLGVIYVAPQRSLKDVERLITPSNPFPSRSDSVDVGGEYAVPRIGAKLNVFDPVDCLATYSQPYGADADYGKGNAYSQTAVKFEVDTDEFALTCSYRWAMAGGQMRLIGGVSYQEVDAFLSRQTLLFLGNEGTGEFKLSDEAWSARAGAAFEVPEYAFRVSILYTGRYDYDLEGTVDTTGFGPVAGPLTPLPLKTGVFGVNASTEIPQAVDVRLQTGLAPGWLGFASIRWQDWSRLQSIAINGVVRPIDGAISQTTSFDPFYEDGWTVSAGVGRKFSETLSGVAALTWDKGTSVDQGFQTDSYALSLGAAYVPAKAVEIRLGGSIGVLTGGRSDFERGDPANAVVYSFDGDLFAAGSAAIKIGF